jgi:hypothetical protein
MHGNWLKDLRAQGKTGVSVNIGKEWSKILKDRPLSSSSPTTSRVWLQNLSFACSNGTNENSKSSVHKVL